MLSFLLLTWNNPGHFLRFVKFVGSTPLDGDVAAAKAVQIGLPPVSRWRFADIFMQPRHCCELTLPQTRGCGGEMHLVSGDHPSNIPLAQCSVRQNCDAKARPTRYMRWVRCLVGTAWSSVFL